MTTTDKWKTLDWREIESEVFRMQRRIFRKTQENRREDVKELQQLLTNSWSARCLAVRKATEERLGRKTPGVDGKADLSDAEKWRLAEELSLVQRPSPVKRVHIPKPGSAEKRPLGIPTLADRALQHLIVLALEPEWETRFSPHQYGFRRGRGCHDALLNIRRRIMRSPKWVLDADIEKFFDRLDHSAILRKLDTWPKMETAVRRILTAGVMEGPTLNPTEMGTPQGGPLSPLLANIALSNLEGDLETTFARGTKIGDHKLSKAPQIVIYADDLIAMHDQREVIEAIRRFLDQWLAPLGLNLSQKKTRIVHTLETTDGHQAGLDFLGCRIQQFRLGKYARSNIWTLINPSRDAEKEFLQKAKEIIRKYGPYKKRNASYQQRKANGKAGPTEVMILHLNRLIRGWCGYHRYHHAKKAFSKMDNRLFWILWQWAKRSNRRKRRRQIVDTLFNGANKWRFGIQSGAAGKPVLLLKAAETKIERHILVQSNRSYFDGDWAYWAKRLGEYPGFPTRAGTLLNRQRGKCPACRQPILKSERVAIASQQYQREGTLHRRMLLTHEICVDKLESIQARENPFQRCSRQ